MKATPRKLGDTGSKELPQWCHFTLEFSFSLNNRACRQFSKLLLLWRREGEEVKVIRWGFCSGAQAFHGKDNAISTFERSNRAFVPLSFPWFQYLLTNRNRTPSKMVVIIYYYKGYKDNATPWYLYGFPDGSNLGSTV